MHQDNATLEDVQRALLDAKVAEIRLLKSAEHVADISGWTIHGDTGSAEFNVVAAPQESLRRMPAPRKPKNAKQRKRARRTN